MTTGPLELAPTGPLPLVVTATGGDTLVVTLALLTMAVAAVLGALVAVRAYRGYRGSGDPALLSLAVGIVLLSAGPTVLRFVVPTLTAIPALSLETATAGSQLLGLAAILYAIYATH